MMKLIPYLRKGIKLFIKDIRMMTICFLILPMALAFVYGSMYKDLFDRKEPKIKAVKVDIKYKEDTPKGAVLKEILSQREVKKFIMEEPSNPEYTILISQDFKTAEISGKDEGAVQFIMLKNFVTTILNNFNQYESMQNTVNGLRLNEVEKKNLMNDVISALNKAEKRPIVRENIIEGYRTLNSIEYYTISMFSFTSLIMIITLAGYFYKEVKEGIVKRSLSTPNNRRDYFLGFVLNSFIVSFTISSVYIIINRARGIAFVVNPLYLIPVVLLQSLLCASAVGMVIAFIKKEMTANVLMNLLLMVPSMFGGVFFNIEMAKPGIIKTIVNSVPNALILNSYKGLALTGELSSIQGEMLVMAGLSIMLIILSIIKIETRWEV